MIHFIDSSSMMLALTLCAGDSSCLSVCPSEESCPGVMLLLYEDKLTCNKWTFKKTSGPKEFQSCCFFLTVLFLNIIAHIRTNFTLDCPCKDFSCWDWLLFVTAREWELHRRADTLWAAPSCRERYRHPGPQRMCRAWRCQHKPGPKKTPQ